MARYVYWLRRRRHQQRRRSTSPVFSNGWGPPVLKTCCLKNTTTIDVGVSANIGSTSNGKYDLQLFLDLCIKHWERWMKEVDHQRLLALSAVGRCPTAEAVDALLRFEKLFPQMVKVY